MTTQEIVRQLEAQIADATQKRDTAINQANYHQGQIDALKSILQQLTVQEEPHE